MRARPPAWCVSFLATQLRMALVGLRYLRKPIPPEPIMPALALDDVLPSVTPPPIMVPTVVPSPFGVAAFPPIMLPVTGVEAEGIVVEVAVVVVVVLGVGQAPIMAPRCELAPSIMGVGELLSTVVVEPFSALWRPMFIMLPAPTLLVPFIMLP